MAEPAAQFSNNESRFQLYLQGVEAIPLVQSWLCHSDGLSSAYQIQLSVTCSQPLPAPELIPAANLAVQTDAGERHFHGDIDNMSFTRYQRGQYYYELTLVAPHWNLRQGFHNRSFTGQSLEDIVSTVLQAAGWASQFYTFNSDKYKTRIPLATQYRQSDHVFLNTLLANHGCCYYLEQHADNYQLVFTDSSQLPTTTTQLSFITQSGQYRDEPSCFYLSPRQQLLPYSVSFDNHDSDSPATKLQRTQQLHEQHNMTHSRYAYDHMDSYITALSSAANTFQARTDDPTLQAGQILAIVDHTNDDFNNHYRIIDVSHQGAETGDNLLSAEANLSARYSNTVTLQAINQPYNPPLSAVENINYVIPAQLLGSSTQASVDSQGRYECAYYFTADDPQSHSFHVRKLQHSTDLQGGIGTHFPTQGQAEAMLMYRHGQDNQPWLLGYVQDEQHSSPSHVGDHTRNTLRSLQGQLLQFNDFSGQHMCLLSTYQQHNQLALNAYSDTHSIKLSSMLGNVICHAGQDIEIRAERQQQLHTEQDHIINVQGQHQLLTQAGDLNYSSGQDINFGSTATIRIESQQDDNQWYSQTELFVTSEQDTYFFSEQGTIWFLAETKNYHMHANKQLQTQTYANGTTTLQKGQQQIVIANGGTLQLNGSKLLVRAQQINLQESSGMNCSSPSGGGSNNTGGGGSGGRRKRKHRKKDKASTSNSDNQQQASANDSSLTQDTKTDVNTDTDATNTCDYPTVAIDLGQLPVHRRIIQSPATSIVAEIEFSLAGSIELQQSGSCSATTFSLDEYKITAKNTASQFSSAFNFIWAKENKGYLSSNITSDFWNTYIKQLAPNQVELGAEPKPIELTHNGWLITGTLGFNAKITYLSKPDTPIQAAQPNHLSIKKGLIIASVGLVALGAAILAPETIPVIIRISPVLAGTAIMPAAAQGK